MRRKESLGSTIMVLQQQFNHQQRLHAIYSRHPQQTTHPATNYSHLHTSYSKKQQYDDQQHLRNIRQLVATLNRDKTIPERKKDPHDFFAYPAFFFRDVPKQTQKPKKRQKKLQKVKSVGHIPPQEEASKVSLQRVRQFLPLLSNFDQSQLQQVADGINKMIISLDIISPSELRHLQDKVISLLPSHTPNDFAEAVEIIFEQIEQQMDQ